MYTLNASLGIDTVLRNVNYQPGDVIICFSSVYGSFGYTIQHLTETTVVEAKSIDLTYPVDDSVVIKAFEDTVKEVLGSGRRAVLALFDTVSSLPGVRVPFERLTELCRLYGILSCIDGAHSVGHFPLDLKSLDPDFFSSNLHKWLHVPRGCAVLYVPLRNQHLLRTTYPTGFGFVALPGPPNFVANFASLGTLDDASYLCVEAALEWRSKLTWNGEAGENAIMGYTQDLAQRGGRAVAAILGTEILENVDKTLGECSLTNIRLPLATISPSTGEEELTKIGAWIQQTMTFEHFTAVNVFVYDSAVLKGKAIWVRLSAQVYLNLLDFERAAYALKTVCERATSGEWHDV